MPEQTWLANTLTLSEGPQKRSINWLVVFDNVESASTLEYYWPTGSGGSILVTSRSTDLCRNFVSRTNQVDIQPFSRTVGQEFLLSLLSNSFADTSAEDANAAEQISDALGHLPLALNLIGTYVATNGLSYSRFLTTHRDFDRDFLFGRLPLYWDAQAYQRSINDTWTLNYSNLDANARFLMDLLAFMDTDGVKIEFFQAKTRGAL